jgi:hypothetical protein
LTRDVPRDDDIIRYAELFVQALALGRYANPELPHLPGHVDFGRDLDCQCWQWGPTPLSWAFHIPLGGEQLTGRNNKLAGQIGEYLVCAELGRRGYIATPFAGNVPTFDVLAADDQCRTVPIQVKASRSNNWPSDARSWMNLNLDVQTGIQRCNSLVALKNPHLIYVCVAIASTESKERDRFFILTKTELQNACVAGYSRWMDAHGWKRPRNPSSYDNRYDIALIERFEDNWELITRRLAESAPDSSLPDDEAAA